MMNIGRWNSSVLFTLPAMFASPTGTPFTCHWIRDEFQSTAKLFHAVKLTPGIAAVYEA